jgi:hypothetical protein
VDAVYERIGQGYRERRRPDPRWEARVVAALGAARSVLNVGAGSGSYEPSDRRVVALEPSATMLAQRVPTAAPVTCGVAERLPHPDRSFDAAMAILTTHHWRDASEGFAEMQRVAPRQVVLTWDPLVAQRYWLVVDYLPELEAHDAALATLDATLDGLGADADVEPLPVPADCVDGVLAAYWNRPEAYLDPSVRAAISGLSLLDQELVASAIARLAADLESGAWHDRHGHLLDLDALDLGYRLVTRS